MGQFLAVSRARSKQRTGSAFILPSTCSIRSIDASTSSSADTSPLRRMATISVALSSIRSDMFFSIGWSPHLVNTAGGR